MSIPWFAIVAFLFITAVRAGMTAWATLVAIYSRNPRRRIAARKVLRVLGASDPGDVG